MTQRTLLRTTLCLLCIFGGFNTEIAFENLSIDPDGGIPYKIFTPPGDELRGSECKQAIVFVTRDWEEFDPAEIESELTKKGCVFAWITVGLNLQQESSYNSIPRKIAISLVHIAKNLGFEGGTTENAVLLSSVEGAVLEDASRAIGFTRVEMNESGDWGRIVKRLISQRIDVFSARSIVSMVSNRFAIQSNDDANRSVSKVVELIAKVGTFLSSGLSEESELIPPSLNLIESVTRDLDFWYAPSEHVGDQIQLNGTWDTTFACFGGNKFAVKGAKMPLGAFSFGALPMAVFATYESMFQSIDTSERVYKNSIRVRSMNGESTAVLDVVGHYENDMNNPKRINITFHEFSLSASGNPMSEEEEIVLKQAFGIDDSVSLNGPLRGNPQQHSDVVYLDPDTGLRVMSGGMGGTYILQKRK